MFMPSRVHASVVLVLALVAQATASAPAPSRGRNEKGTITAGGRQRSFLVHLPPAYETQTSLPVVLAFHGGGGTGQGMRRLTGFDGVADKAGFIVVYPDGLNHHWNDGRPEVSPAVDDVGFVSALVDRLAQKHKADPNRIYATGISNGSLFSFRLACELSDKIAAVAPLGSPMGEALAKRSTPPRPVPVLFIHGTDDPLAPWAGGDIGGWLGRRGRALSAAGTVSFWVKHNNCAPVPIISYEPDKDPRDGTRVRREEYRPNEGGREVVLLAIEGGGHTWPGGWQYLPERLIGKTSRDINASEVIWQFFKKHARH